MSTWWRQLAGAAAIIVAVLAVASPAWALFRDTHPVAGNGFQTATLLPPTGLTITSMCPGPGQGYRVTASWTASASTFEQGYEIEYAPSAGGPWYPYGTTSATSATANGISRQTTFWVRVRAYAYSWRSTWVVRAHTTPSANC